MALSAPTRRTSDLQGARKVRQRLRPRVRPRRQRTYRRHGREAGAADARPRNPLSDHLADTETPGMSGRFHARPTRTPAGQGIRARTPPSPRSEEHTSELQSLMRISYALFCLKKKDSTYTPLRTPVSYYYP